MIWKKNTKMWAEQVTGDNRTCAAIAGNGRELYYIKIQWIGSISILKENVNC